MLVSDMRVHLPELPEYAANVLASLWMQGPKKSATLVALRGELGSGKTTFVQTLLRRLGVKENIQSPTYVLMKTYPLDGPLTTFGERRRFNRVMHIDAYRLKNAAEFAALQPVEFLQDPKALVLLEWPERVEGALPPPDLTINFSSEGASEGERFIEIF